MSNPSCASCLDWHRRRDLFISFILLVAVWWHEVLPFDGIGNARVTVERRKLKFAFVADTNVFIDANLVFEAQIHYKGES